jgi:muramoyltetrapeptide carboxypeptidase
MTKPLTFGICAPSSYAVPERFEAGVQQLQSLGHKLVIHPQARGRFGTTQSAGTVPEKLAAFYELLNNPEIDAIMFASGGNFAAHLLDKINYAVIQKNPKPIIGYSDTIALLNAMHAKTGITTYHGPMVNEHRPEKFNAVYHDQLINLITGNPAPITLTDAVIQKSGTATGKLIGGNLTIFQHLLHTPYCPDLSGAVLFFEDIGGEINGFDRCLNYFRLLGLFERAAGIIFGQFTDMKDTGRPFGFTLEEIIATHTADLNIPIITGAPFGHIGMFPTFPIGARVMVDAGQGIPTVTLVK